MRVATAGSSTPRAQPTASFRPVRPLMVNGKAIGILRVYSSEERDFTPDECDFMLGVANISAIAIENARMHEATRLNYELLTSYNYQVFED